MATATFDTLKFAKMLKAAGVPDQQAEGPAEAFSEVINFNFRELATKDDLSREILATRDDLSREILATRDDLSREIADLRKEMDGRFEGVARDIADLRKDIKHDLTAFDSKFVAFDSKFVAFDSKFIAFEGKFTALDGKFTAQFERIRGEQILVRWMLGLVISSNVALVALVVRLVFFQGLH